MENKDPGWVYPSCAKDNAREVGFDLDTEAKAMPQSEADGYESTLTIQAKEELLGFYEILDVQEDKQQDQDKEEDEEFLP